MYDYIKGTLERKTEHYAVVEAGGIGYRISSSARSLQAVGGLGSPVTFYTYLHVREDIFELYGFSSQEERASFELLLSVSGVGPKAALSILSALSPASLALAIVTNDPKAISAAQGVGPKLAQRIILELKDKIKNNDLVAGKDDFVAPAPLENEAVSALIALGYSPTQAAEALRGAPTDLSVEDAIKYGLKQLMKA